MDLGDPVERLALNQEHVRLAVQLGDTPECRRGYLRSAVDAMELGDAATLDDAIEQCNSLSAQLGMPHYQWQAAALRVMRATSRGEFAAAEAALGDARRLADRAQDSNAALTLLVQQLALAEMTDDKPKLEALCARLDRQCAGMPHSEMYLKPALLAAATRSLGRSPNPADLDEAFLRRIIRFSDMGAFASLGEYLATLGNPALAQLAYDSILPYRQRCGHWGLLGMRWMGPVERSLGHLAAALGRVEAANEHFAAALETARRMGARPWISRIVLEWVECLRGAAPQRALLLLEEAQAIAAELGLTGLAEKIERLRVPGGEPAGSGRAARPALRGLLPAVIGRRSLGL